MQYSKSACWHRFAILLGKVEGLSKLNINMNEEIRYYKTLGIFIWM